ncbi:MAG: DNA repair protein RecO [Candidatus Margulisbacteria bacterium]|nr:DNA repair protein RecO [Candidatus Margulisiibacteriota bacterium]
MAPYKTKAISIRTKPFMEADKMVTLFTRDHGKIRAIAKGARRVPSSLGGRVETFTYADYFIAKGRNLDIISQGQVIETFQRIRENPEMLPSGLYMIKLVDSGTAEGQPYPELFDLLLQSLLRLKIGDPARRVAKDFEKSFVVLEGIHCEGVDPQYALSEHVGKDLRSW